MSVSVVVVYWPITNELALTGLGTKVRGMGLLGLGLACRNCTTVRLPNLYRSAALSAVSVESGYTTKEHETVSGLAGQWQFAAWGEWMIASNGTMTQFKYAKGTGSFGPLLQDGTTALVISKAKLFVSIRGVRIS